MPKRDTRCGPAFHKIFSNTLSSSQLYREPEGGPGIAPACRMDRLVQFGGEVV
jgi:hypothetical protein